jgi:hypothetical protein
MTQKDDILQELKVLNSSLANLSRQNVYTVPAGYFNDLTEQILSRIKTLEAIELNEETGYSTPFLNSVSKEAPYTVPPGYFDSLSDNVLNIVRNSNDYQTAKEELESLSPLLSGIKKEVPYSVPAGYFENLTKDIIAEENTSPAKIITLSSRKWFRYAAAAVVTGFIVLSGFLYFGKNNNSAEPGSKVMAKITKDIKNMNLEEQDDLIDFIDAGLNGKELVQSKNNKVSAEIQDLLIGISDAELKDFQEQSEDIQTVLLLN